MTGTDGALGFWAALREVFPQAKEQRCCSTRSPTCWAPQQAGKAFADAYGAKWPKAAAKITDDLNVLLEFYDYPAQHWIHLRTTNPIWVRGEQNLAANVRRHLVEARGMSKSSVHFCAYWILGRPRG